MKFKCEMIDGSTVIATRNFNEVPSMLVFFKSIDSVNFFNSVKESQHRNGNIIGDWSKVEWRITDSEDYTYSYDTEANTVSKV